MDTLSVELVLTISKFSRNIYNLILLNNRRIYYKSYDKFDKLKATDLIDYYKFKVYGSERYIIPENITYLHIKSDLDTRFNLKIDTLTNIKFIRFSYMYKDKINLPKNLKYLIFTCGTDCSGMYTLNNLPDSITHLKIGNYDDRPAYSTFTEIKLPKCITYFNCSAFVQIPINLPDTITYLSLNGSFRFRYLLELPKNLTYLELGGSFNQDLINLPETLTTLKLGYEFDKSLKNLPKLKTLYIGEYYHYDRYDYGIGSYFEQSIDDLPDSITCLRIWAQIKAPITKLPKNLKRLTLDLPYNPVIENIPNSVTHLELGGNFNQYIEFPPFLKHLSIMSLYSHNKYSTYECKFNRSLLHLPKSIETLSFGDGICTLIPFDLPNIKHIEEILIGYREEFRLEYENEMKKYYNCFKAT